MWEIWVHALEQSLLQLTFSSVILQLIVSLVFTSCLGRFTDIVFTFTISIFLARFSLFNKAAYGRTCYLADLISYRHLSFHIQYVCETSLEYVSCPIQIHKPTTHCGMPLLSGYYVCVDKTTFLIISKCQHLNLCTDPGPCLHWDCFSLSFSFLLSAYMCAELPDSADDLWLVRCARAIFFSILSTSVELT